MNKHENDFSIYFLFFFYSGINRNQRRIEDLRMRTHWSKYEGESDSHYSDHDDVGNNE